MPSTVLRRLTACVTLVIVLSCSRGSGGQDPSVPVNDLTPARRVPTNSKPANLPSFSPPDLTWDGPIGWEPRPIFPVGVTHLERQEGTDYVNLKYFPWNDAKVNALMLGALRSFETTALLMPHERLCEPAWIKAIEQAQPPRLLLRIEGDPTPQQWDCLQDLGTSDLYLGLCHATNPAFWGCDGNLQLQALELRPQLRGRVRGLGVAFTKAELWSVFPKFPRLSHLTIRGSATREGPSPKLQADLCALPDLFSVDLLDATEPGRNPQLPVACALGLGSYAAWQLLDGEAPPAVKCRLRHALFWSLDEASIAVLDRCSNLTLEVVRP